MANASNNQSSQRVSVWVKLFVLFHVLAITLYALPQPPAAVREGRVQPGGTQWLIYWNQKYVKSFPLIDAYANVSGFWQYWDMFAPNPAHTDKWGDAEVVYRDGSVKRYAYPRMFKLPLWKKFLQERYRKFFERAGDDKFPYLWPSFGLRIALLNDNPKNPPVMVRLYRYSREVAAPGKVQPEAYTCQLYFTYIVDQKELQRVRSLPL